MIAWRLPLRIGRTPPSGKRSFTLEEAADLANAYAESFLQIAEPENVAGMLLFSIVALVASGLAARTRTQNVVARAEAGEAVDVEVETLSAVGPLAKRTGAAAVNRFESTFALIVTSIVAFTVSGELPKSSALRTTSISGSRDKTTPKIKSAKPKMTIKPTMALPAKLSVWNA